MIDSELLDSNNGTLRFVLWALYIVAGPLMYYDRYIAHTDNLWKALAAAVLFTACYALPYSYGFRLGATVQQHMTGSLHIAFVIWFVLALFNLLVDLSSLFFTN